MILVTGASGFVGNKIMKLYENVIACLMDDVSVSVLHSMGKAEEGE